MSEETVDPGDDVEEPADVPRIPEARFATVTAAESESAENPDDLDRAAEIVASMADASLLRSAAAVIAGFVVLTIGSVVAGRLIASAADVTAETPMTTAFLAQNLLSRLVVAAVAGYLTARVAPKRPMLHGIGLAGLVAFMAAGALVGLLAAGTMEDPAWYPFAMLFVGPFGVLIGAYLRVQRAAGTSGPGTSGTAASSGTMRTPGIIALVCLGAQACGPPPDDPVPPSQPDEPTAVSPPTGPTGLDAPTGRNFIADHETFVSSDLVRVVIEIPAGTNDKWHTEKEAGDLVWELEDGVPRVVQYLAYPANYGMIPRTLLPRLMGGDGDPLDVIVLGSAIERGTIIEARPIGVLRLLDGGEQDDKILAVPGSGPFEGVRDLDDLRREFPGVLEIVETWFANYKGPGETEAQGAHPADVALETIRRASEAYEGWTTCGPLDDGQGHGPDPFGEEWWGVCERMKGFVRTSGSN